MEVQGAIKLLQPAFKPQTTPSIWADLGCGSGLFTIALARLIKEGSTIYAVDSNARVLESIHLSPGIHLKKIEADFAKEHLPLPELDGLLMANSLHFVKDKLSFVREAGNWLKENGRFLLVEYDTDSSNQWVPYPLSFISAQKLFREAGYAKAVKLADQPSLYQRTGMYSALFKQ